MLFNGLVAGLSIKLFRISRVAPVCSRSYEQRLRLGVLFVRQPVRLVTKAGR
jgi:hypothetical protein